MTGHRRPITAHKDGTGTGLSAEAGSSVGQDTVLCEIKDGSG